MSLSNLLWMYGAIQDMDDQAIVDAPYTEDLLGHKRRTFATLRWQEWSFVTVSILSLGAVAGLTIQRIVQFATQASNWTQIKQPGHEPEVHLTTIDFAFACVLLLNVVFCFYYVLSGLFRERLFEMYMYIASVIVVVLYCVVEYILNTDSRTQIKLIRMIIGAVLGPVNIALAILVVRSFGWLEFRVVGASETLQKMYRQRNLFFSILALDVQATASFLILALNDGNSGDDTMALYKVLIASLGTPLTVVWSFVASVAVQRELKWLCYLVTVLGLCVPAYIIIQAIVMTHSISDFQEVEFLVASTIICGVIFVFVRILTLQNMWRAVKNFDRGLKDEVFNFETFTHEIHKIRDLCGCC